MISWMGEFKGEEGMRLDINGDGGFSNNHAEIRGQCNVGGFLIKSDSGIGCRDECRKQSGLDLGWAWLDAK
jgi:hypothetical protein